MPKIIKIDLCMLELYRNKVVTFLGHTIRAQYRYEAAYSLLSTNKTDIKMRIEKQERERRRKDLPTRSRRSR